MFTVVLDALMILTAVMTLVYWVRALRDRVNRQLAQRRDLFTGLFFLFWGLGDIFSRDAAAFGMAFVGFGVVWLMFSFREARQK
jgi:hypothetical protein